MWVFIENIVLYSHYQEPLLCRHRLRASVFPDNPHQLTTVPQSLRWDGDESRGKSHSGFAQIIHIYEVGNHIVRPALSLRFLCCTVDLSTPSINISGALGNPKKQERTSRGPRDIPPVVRHYVGFFPLTRSIWDGTTNGSETSHGAAILPNDPLMPRCKGFPSPKRLTRGGRL